MEQGERGSPGFMVLAGVIANLPGLSVGLAMGFSAILIPQLQEPHSSIQATLEQGSWIASLFVIGDLLGCVIGGPLADKFGRRAAICLDCIPLIVGWLMIWQATSLSHLYMARAITGIGIGAGVPIASIYLREISTPELRGTLVILMPAAANTGNLLMYILGWFLPWRLTTLPGALLPLLPILLLFLLPETPSWLLSRGRRDEAVQSLAKLRGLPEQSQGVKEEIRMMEKLSEEQEEPQNGAAAFKASISKIFNRSVLLPMALLVFLFFTQSFSGSNMVSYYTITIFQMADIPLDENLASILVAAQYVLGYCLSSVFVTRIPRRTLLLASLTIMTLANLSAGIVLLYRDKPTPLLLNSSQPIVEADFGLGDGTAPLLLPSPASVLGGDLPDPSLLDVPDPSLLPLQEHSDLEHAISLVPVMSCILITFGYACGLGPVPFILFGELFPNKVRGAATSITAFLRSITVFLSIKIFPSLLWMFDIGGSFLSCAAVCAFAIGVSYLYVPETKGLNTRQLESIYSGTSTPSGSESVCSRNGSFHKEDDARESLVKQGSMKSKTGDDGSFHKVDAGEVDVRVSLVKQGSMKSKTGEAGSFLKVDEGEVDVRATLVKQGSLKSETGEDV